MGGTRLRTGRRTVKGVTGYDVTALLVGSEGTLAVFSEVTLRLVPKPPEVATLLALFADVRGCGGRRGGDRRARASSRAASSCWTRPRSRRCARAASAIDAARGRHAAHRGRRRRAARAKRRCERVGERLHRRAARSMCWSRRTPRSAIGSGRRAASSRRPRGRWRSTRSREDVVVPAPAPRRACSTEVDAHRRATGDPHAHLRPRRRRQPARQLPLGRPTQAPAVERAHRAALPRASIALGGTLSRRARHRRRSRPPYLPLEQSSELIELQKQLKACSIPKGLLNPGKIFPTAGIGLADRHDRARRSIPGRVTSAGACCAARRHATSSTSRTGSSTPTRRLTIAVRLVEIDTRARARSSRSTGRRRRRGGSALLRQGRDRARPSSGTRAAWCCCGSRGPGCRSPSTRPRW